MQAIDMNSPEFQDELEKTWKFVHKVNESRGWVLNPNDDVNEGVAMGLARNKMIYGKRFCPCFMVIGETKEEQKAADNRICPCKPAIEKEIPEDGHCHCGIFCTPDYAAANSVKEEEEATPAHSKGLTKEEAQELMTKEQLEGHDLESLIEARSLGMVEFTLVDVREDMEYRQAHIVGTDLLLPTSNFYAGVEELNPKKEEQIILYCLSGSRSYQVQQVMGKMGFNKVGNLAYGIGNFRGDMQSA